MNINSTKINPLHGIEFKFEQTENSTRKYELLWGPLLPSAVTISTSAFEVLDGNATLASASSSGGTTSVFISGIPGENKVQNKITLSNGEIYERILKVKIKDNDPPSISDDYDFVGD